MFCFAFDLSFPFQSREEDLIVILKVSYIFVLFVEWDIRWFYIYLVWSLVADESLFTLWVLGSVSFWGSFSMKDG